MDAGLYGYTTPKLSINDQIQNHARALEALKVANPDLGGTRKSPSSSPHRQTPKDDPYRPRFLPKTPQLNSDENRAKLERQLAQRQEAYEKEQAWTRKQIQRLNNERLKLEDEEKKFEEAKKRWNIPSPVLDPISGGASQEDGKDDPQQFQQMYKRISENLQKMRAEYNKHKKELEEENSFEPSNKNSYHTAHTMEYYMIRDILVDVVNQAVDYCTDKELAKKKRDFTALLLAAAEKEYDSSQDIQRRERVIQLIAEEMILQITGKMTVEAIQEWLSVEEYVRSATQRLIINSSEAVATNDNSGRDEDDPAYNLITATYFHLCKDRYRKRSSVWKHTQTVHYVDPESQNVTSGVTSELDVTKLDMSRLVPVHLWPEKKRTPTFDFYRKRERAHWQADRMTIQPFSIQLSKKVSGVLSAAVSPTQRMLAVGCVRGDILVFDLWYDSSNPVRYIRNEGGAPDGVMHLSWTLDGGRIASSNESGSVFMWSMHPGGTNTKDNKNLEFRDDADDIAPSQLTMLLAMESDADDFDFQEGPLAQSRVQTESQVPVITAFHPSHTLLGSQNSLMVGFENGDFMKCNVEHQISGRTDQFENTENVMFPTVQTAANLVGQDIPAELFRAHKYGLIYLGFVGNYGNIISVDAKGHIFIWKYTRKKVNHYGWFEPLMKFWLEMAEEVYVTTSNETPEIYFSDDYALEKKKMKGKDAARMKAELEMNRQDAEIEWTNMKITQLWFKDENKKLGTETSVYRPDFVDEKGSPFHTIVRRKETGLLLKHYSQIHKPIQNFASRMLGCRQTPSGKELVFMLLFPPSPPKAGHITFVVLKTDRFVEVRDMRIDVSLTNEKHEQCLKEDVCSFEVSSVLDASGSSYIYMTLLGSLMIFSLNTGALVLSSRKVDLTAAIQWTPKSPTRLWDKSSIALANTRGSTYAVLYAEEQTTIRVLKVTDRNTPEKRQAVQKAFKFWNRKNAPPAPEQSIRRHSWSLDHDVDGHVGLYVTRLILQLADDAIKEVEGAFSEEDAERYKKNDRKLAHHYFKGKLQTGAERATSIDAGRGDDVEDTGPEIQAPTQGGDDLRNDEAEEHPTV